MLTYATRADFIEMVDLGKGGIVSPLPSDSNDKIDQYLRRATRYIKKQTRRDFFPWIETREYTVPYAYYDLAIRRFPSAHLKLDQDLLEIFVLNNGVEDVDSDFYYPLEHNIYPKDVIAIKYPKYWGGQFGGVSPFKRYDEPIVTVQGLWGFHDFDYPREAWVDTLEDVEAGGINATQTALQFTDTEGVDAFGLTRVTLGSLLRIENELLEVTAVDTDTDVVTVLRGVRGSTAAAHDENTDIKRWRVVDDIVECTLNVAKTWREADVSAGGRMGVSDVSVGVEIGIPADALEIIKSYQRSLV